MSGKDYTLQEIANGLAYTIKSGVQSTLYTYVAPSELGELSNGGAVLIEPITADFAGTMNRGTDTWEFFVYVMVSRADLPTAVTRLSNFLTGSGPDSIRRAIFDNPQLGLGDDISAFVHGMHGYGGSFKWYDVPHVGAVLMVRVHVN